MIGSVRGTVIDRALGGEVLVEVQGVGHRVNVSARTLVELAVGEPAFLFTHLHVRDDAFVLYGFPSRDERDMFEALLGATGVGPKLALAILSVHAPRDLQRLVAAADLDALTMVPGVGKRTAQRLLIELQARLGAVSLDEPVVLDGVSARGEVREALTSLGYAPEEVREVLTRLGDDATVEDLLRDALKMLAATR
ncbi:MAG TPA: Holliday junction branch migration protein RuvA [Acidimicrobiia bacterium]|nr:Holliday junction branch migration protein RuvA [Acidimicrobiia bacterium]